MATSGLKTFGGVQTGITATAGGGTPNVTAIVGVNVVSVVGTTGDSLYLPAGTAKGAEVVVVVTAAAGTVDVWPNTGATINGYGVDADVGVAVKTGATFIQVGSDGLTWVADNIIAAVS